MLLIHKKRKNQKKFFSKNQILTKNFKIKKINSYQWLVCAFFLLLFFAISGLENKRERNLSAITGTKKKLFICWYLYICVCV